MSKSEKLVFMQNLSLIHNTIEYIQYEKAKDAAERNKPGK